MKNKLISRVILWVWLLLIAFSCDNDDEPTPIEITVSPLQVTIAENPQNGDLLGKLNATTNQGTLAFSLTNENPVGAMAIDASTGNITVADASLFDYESNTTISAMGNVTAEGKVATANITITLTDVDESTLSAQDFAVTIDENPTDGQVLGTVSATADAASTIAYSINSQTPNGALAINASSGQLTVADSVLFDYETSTSITADVRVSTATKTVDVTATITLNDLSEVTLTANDFTGTVDENSANGTVIGMIDASITSGSGTIVYSVVNQSVDGAVSINANGQIAVANQSVFDYEAQTQITGTYRAAVGNIGDNASFTITINNLDEHVVTAQDFTVSIDENPNLGVFIGNVSEGVGVTGQLGNPKFTLISQSVNGAIRMDTLGRMYVNQVADFDYETNTQIIGVFKVEVTDSTSPTSSATANFTININDKFSWTKVIFAGQVGAILDTDGQGTAARFHTPRGMAFDASGNLYVTDQGNHRIRKIDDDANVTTYAGTTRGSNGGFNAQFNFPRDVDVDASGNVWVADEGNQAVRYILPNGNTVYPNGRGIGFAPRGIVVQGNFVYLARDHRIRRLNISTERIDSYIIGGGPGTNTPGFQDATSNQALFNVPLGIDINNAGELLIADSNNRKIRKVNNSNEVSSFPGAYFQVTDVEVAPDGKIYAVETGNKRVRIVTDSGVAVDEIIIDGFDSPTGIAIHPTTGEIYVSDAGRHVIYKLEKVEE